MPDISGKVLLQAFHWKRHNYCCLFGTYPAAHWLGKFPCWFGKSPSLYGEHFEVCWFGKFSHLLGRDPEAPWFGQQEHRIYTAVVPVALRL